jgi:hypothetical protein
MPYFSSLQNFIDSVTARLTKPRRGVGGSEGVVTADVIEALTDVGKYSDDMRVATNALNAGFVARSLNLNATVYVRGDTGSDTRTGEVDTGAAANGPIKTLERAVALHSGKTAKLTIVILSGLVELTSDQSVFVPTLTVVVQAGATLRFQKRASLKDGNNVTVGEGNFRLLCFSDMVTVNVSGYLEIIDHAPYSGAGDIFFYRTAQGVFSLCTDNSGVFGLGYQTLTVSHVGNIYVGNNATLAAYGTHGLNGYGSELARYKRVSLGGSITLGTAATESALVTDKLRETLVFEGNGSAKSFNIRRAYDFAFEIVYNDGCTITVQPAASCSANANNTLTFTGAVGKTVTVRLTSNLPL